MTAETWHAAMKRARQLEPDRIAQAIQQSAPSGLKAARYDSNGGRTSRVPCTEEGCDDGPEAHSHHVVNDPTGNAATRGRGRDTSSDDLSRLARAESQFVGASNEVLSFVAGETTATWVGVLHLNARLMPGTVQAGLDVDHEHVLPSAIARASSAVSDVAAIAARHMPRLPSIDEQHWTAGLADEDCCAWHLSVHRRYRRPRRPGTNICQDCTSLALVLGGRPPQWLLEAEVDRESRPKAWTAALSRAMDELGIVREAG